MFLYCLPIFYAGQTAFAEENPVYVVAANKASIFEEPDFASEKITSLSHGMEVELTLENGAPVEFENDGFVFFKVNSLEGYIFSDLVVLKRDVITSIPNFNGQANNTCVVYLLEDNKLVESEIVLQKGQRFYLYEGFNNHSEYTKIAFLYENSIIYGQIKTGFVKPDGINPVIITCIILILAVLGIIFAWLFMKNKKVKLKKNKKKFKIPDKN